ncbi:hypothetical protein BDBG_09127 [Blastomyces gilchristii SLH14081]|uniref:Fungal-type protein kinase domain-containing protein n=1 Tax=Blastomyces gilchristii (strain SLH14081) TaxID=559298 RepID=A0A179V3P1_BLAGS|nr:uncharacterized protein BDBG_09127 [Blastomyces gilchristii SLH14081]OAT14037.1 hypothetical protein BDBG_09127 [Blastomyces gilchristii SLH14081]
MLEGTSRGRAASPQYPERDEEGELLYEAAAHGVTHVARYYHHETVRVDGRADDVLGIRKGLLIPTTGQKRAGAKPASGRSRSRQAHKDSNSITGQKRSSECVDAALPPPPSKRTQSSSPTKHLTDGKPQNRVHRRVVVRDYGKHIFESSSRIALLNAGLVQSDISHRNLLVNEDKDNPSYRAFLINLDLAIRVERDGFSQARVSAKGVKDFEESNYVNTDKLGYKKEMSDQE